MQFLEDKNYLHETWCDTCAEHEMTAQCLCPQSANLSIRFAKLNDSVKTILLHQWMVIYAQFSVLQNI